MALKATKAEVWAVSIDDRAGGVADKLEALAKAGANFEMAFARRTPENPGKGMLFVTPVKGAKVTRAAREAGMGTPQEHLFRKDRGRGSAGPGSEDRARPRRCWDQLSRHQRNRYRQEVRELPRVRQRGRSDKGHSGVEEAEIARRSAGRSLGGRMAFAMNMTTVRQ